MAASEESHFEQVMAAIASRNTAPAPRPPYQPNPNVRCRRCKTKGHVINQCTITDDDEAARMYAAWEGESKPTPRMKLGVAEFTAIAHLLQCCCAAEFPEAAARDASRRGK